MYTTDDSFSPIRRLLPVLTGVTILGLAATAPRAAGQLQTFTFTANVVESDSTLADDVASLQDGDLIQGYITFDLSRPDQNSSPANGVYNHLDNPAGIYATVQGLTFQTSTSAGLKLAVRVDNDVSQDVYAATTALITSNTPNPPFVMDFQLVDTDPPMMPDAISSDVQPSVPYNLSDFDPYDQFGSRFVIQGTNYEVVAEITALELNLIVAEDGFATAFDCDAPTAVCFPTIQDAIDTLGSGDLIEVCPGNYSEDIEFPIGKDGMELSAVDPNPALTTIKGQSNVPSASFPLAVPNVHILANDIEIHGFTIQGPDPAAGFYSSGTVVGGDNAYLHDNVFEVTNAASLADISQGLQTYRDANNPTGGDVDGLLITNNTFTSHGAGDAGYEAIFINHVTSGTAPADSVTISNNFLTGKLIRGITSERSKTDILENNISTDLAPSSGPLSVGESLQAVNIIDFSNRDQQDVNIHRNTIGVNAALPNGPAATLIITGVVDGPLTGGTPKAIEFYATGDIADLSEYGFGSANNGGGTNGEEFTFPADSVTGGSFIYVATNSTSFSDFFGFAPDYTDGNAPNINGDDAIELFHNGSVSDVFGDINQDGSGTPWDYLDGWVYRNSMTGPDGSTFVLSNWSFSGINALDGETTNGTAANPFPIGTYAPTPPPSAGGSFGQGIRVGGGTQNVSAISIEENFVNGNDIGVLVRSSAGGVTIYDNDLSGNLSYGADNTDAMADADASGNWWGDNDGVVVGNAAGMSGTVDYTPWLAVGTDTGGGVGFQGDFSELYVDDDSPQTGMTGRIQEGIDLVTASIVHVLAGTYVEQVEVNKSVELLGAQAGVDPTPMGARTNDAAETIVLVDVSDPDPNTAPNPVHFYVTVDDVLIDGFLFDGDNPNLTSGEVLNGADLDAEEAIASYEGVGDITVQNNIIRNTSYTGIDFYNYFDTSATTNNHITNNRIQNLGAFDWGLGILVYNNFYAEISNNAVLDVRVGVQTGNYSKANPGSTASITNNDITARRRGIFYNLHYSNATPFDVSNNDIAGVDDPGAPMGAHWAGMLISSQQTAVDAAFNNNDVDGSAVTSLLSAGIEAWNTPTTSELTVTGGTISGVDYGVWVNNFEGYNSNAANTRLFVENMSISASSVGAYVLDSPSNTNGSTVFAKISNNTDITGAATGVLVEGTDASAVLLNNLASITGNTVGVEVDGATALLEKNNLSGNSQIGLLVHDDGLVDAGDVDDANVTGLGAGSGATNGSSIGYNFLAGYDGVTSYAVVDENLDAAGNIDVQAEANFWGTQDLGEIEMLVDHTVDDAAQTEVFFSDPQSVPQLIITAPEMCQNNGPSQIQVTLRMENLPIAVTGYFAVIQYDPSVLELDSGTYDYAGFTVHLNSVLQDEMPMSPVGLILADGSAAPLSPGTDQDQQLATLTFNVIGCGNSTIGFGPPPTPSIMSQVSFQGIGLTTELVDDSVLIDTGTEPTTGGSEMATAGMLDSSCSTTVSFSATITDDCCMDLMGGASAMGSVSVASGSATLGTPTFNYQPGMAPNEVEVTGSVPVTLDAGCTAEIEFSLDATDCCGNTMPTVTASAIVEDMQGPTFLTPAGSLDVAIECDESTEPGILLGVTNPSSGIAIYYNDNGNGEDGNTNVAYMRSQAAYGNTNAAPFEFSTLSLSGNGVNWAFLFGQVATTQYGLDLVLPAPTYDGSVVLPSLTAQENTDNTLGGSISAGPLTWAVNDYKGGSPNGPANPATSVIHSLLRSATGTPSMDVQDVAIDLSLSGTLYTAEVSGKLISDNTIHWYTVGTPDSPMMDFALDGEFFFSGSLSYDSAGDPGTDLIDFYQGAITVSANSPNTALGFPLAIDNCSQVPTLTYSDVVNPMGCASQVVSEIVRTWTATDDCGNQATFTQTITVVDTTPPVVEQPTNIEVPADAGSGCMADVTVPPLVVSDNCSNLTITNNFNGTSDASDTYPMGTTTVTWTVTDDCGNTTMVSQDVTVLNVNVVNVVVQLADLMHGSNTPLSFQRNIRFVLNDGSNCTADICEMAVDFTGVMGDTPTAMVSFTAPCGDWVSACAKDDHLTLYGTCMLDGTGPAFVGLTDIALKSGDTDNDGDVDINDVTYLLFKYGTAAAVPDACPFDGNRSADFSINGVTSGEDYSIMQANWLLFTDCGCPMALQSPLPSELAADDIGTGVVDAGDLQVSRRDAGNVVVRLRTSDVPKSVADVVDLNRDGLIDYHDVRLFEDRFGLPTTLSAKIRRSTDQRDFSESIEPGDIGQETSKRPRG